VRLIIEERPGLTNGPEQRKSRCGVIHREYHSIMVSHQVDVGGQEIHDAKRFSEWGEGETGSNAKRFSPRPRLHGKSICLCQADRRSREYTFRTTNTCTAADVSSVRQLLESKTSKTSRLGRLGNTRVHQAFPTHEN
jgi:hypothetical protein